ncbi:LacI family DNA-binding transcriptional regulator [Pseudoprimorskyibacter insulae]|uniref:Catabolite control protein A n=1 Tax=Pseudoprimorskyibacter insulae TaxID=1695997 RepID=A0A2R8B163_9RHOB|nr:LacI family DNA-binding transcriptional regulator [Pseudoprimorskyibacter insulae]SPF81967.1 Catabolite control protein A [Pseudoprimorskyibacter insulae]
MSRRPTVKDVAQEAGVSVATVDRALNGRGTVREDTLKRIAEAAHRVGYHARGLFNHRLDSMVPELRLGFVLLKEKQEFYQNFARAIERAVRDRNDIRGKVLIRFATSQSPDDFAHLMREVGARVDAIACVAVNHQMLNQVVQDLKGAGVPTFSLLNDFAQGIRRNYLGLNNMKVGRTAASMITKATNRPGKVAIFVGGNRWHGHDLREVGFRSYMREHAPEFTVLDTLVNLETRRVSYEATLDLLNRHPDLRGIYLAGGGMEGTIAALREARSPGKIALVVNELTADSRAALSEGYCAMVIQTPLDELCRDLIELMIEAHRVGEDGISGQHFLVPHIMLPEMV